MDPFLLFNWEKTKSAIGKLQVLLRCSICNSLCKESQYMGRCDHFYCSKCISSLPNGVCIQCNIPSPPGEHKTDNIINSLVSSASDLLKLINGECIKMQTNNTDMFLTRKECKVNERGNSSIYRVPECEISYLDESPKNKILKKGVPRTPKISTKSPDLSILGLTPKTPSINKRNVKGESVLHLSCIKCDTQSVKDLLEDGANPNTKDNAGWTPLHEACNHGFVEIAELLLKHGAFVDVPGNNNETPLHDAVNNGCINVICLLRKWGADCQLRDIYGKTARSLADICHSPSVIHAALDTVVNDDLKNLPTVPPLQYRMVILESNLSPEYKKKFEKLARLLHVRTAKDFCSDVTHVVIWCDENENICTRTAQYMMAVVSGKWVISHKWIDECLSLGGPVCSKSFEVTGSRHHPNSLAPQLGRKMADRMKPGLFNGCHMFLQGSFGDDYNEPTKKELESIIRAGDGIVLQREPDPEAIPEIEQTVPYHSIVGEALEKCSHFTIYTGAPLLKYDMAHVKSLPLSWLLDCIENCALVPPYI